MYYGIRIIVDFIYGNECRLRSWVGAYVPFEKRKRAESSVLLYVGMGHGHCLDGGNELSNQFYQRADDCLGVWRACRGGPADTDLRQKPKNLFDCKGADRIICGTWNGGSAVNVVSEENNGES